MIRRHLFVAGRVQGVFFRDSCRQQAERLEVSGFARNLADGRVEVVAEGEVGAVADLEAWCHRGSPGAEVSEVAGVDEEPEALHGFRTR